MSLNQNCVDFSERVVIVTGAAGGIARSICHDELPRSRVGWPGHHGQLCFSDHRSDGNGRKWLGR